MPNLESSFRPFITLKYLIQRIFAETNLFTYTSNFIDNDADFQKLFMDFNWGGDTFPTANNEYNGSWNTSDPNANKGTGSFKPLALSTASATSLSGSTLPPNYDEDIADNLITATTTNEMYQIFIVIQLKMLADHLHNQLIFNGCILILILLLQLLLLML